MFTKRKKSRVKINHIAKGTEDLRLNDLPYACLFCISKGSSFLSDKELYMMVSREGDGGYKTYHCIAISNSEPVVFKTNHPVKLVDVEINIKELK